MMNGSLNVSRRRFGLLWAVGFLLVLTVSLPVLAKDKVVIVWPTFTQEKVDFGTYLAEAFQAANPDLDVELVLDYGKLQVLIAAGAAPDVTWEGASGYGRAAQGWYQDLSKFVARDSVELATRDFFPALWAHMHIGDLTWGIPLAANMGVFYYNQSMFDERGVPYPTEQWTTNDVIQAGRRLTRDTNGDNVIDKYGVSLHLNGPTWFYNYGGPVFSADGKTSLFDNPNRGRIFEFYHEVNTTSGISPSVAYLQNYATSNGSPVMFAKEDIALIFGGVAGTVGTLRSMAQFEWNVNTWPWLDTPQGPVRATTYTPESFAIPVGAANPEGGWRFIKFATSYATMAEVTRRGHIFPARLRVAVSDAWNNPRVLPKNINAFAMSMDFAAPHITATHAMGAALNSGTNTPITSYTTGQLPLRTALETAHNAVQTVLDEYNRSR